MAKASLSIACVMKLTALLAVDLAVIGSDPWGMLGWRGVLFPLLSLNMVLVQAFILGRPLRAFHYAFLTFGMVSSIVEVRFVGGGVSTIV